MIPDGGNGGYIWYLFVPLSYEPSFPKRIHSGSSPSLNGTLRKRSTHFSSCGDLNVFVGELIFFLDLGLKSRELFYFEWVWWSVSKKFHGILNKILRRPCGYCPNFNSWKFFFVYWDKWLRKRRTKLQKTGRKRKNKTQKSEQKKISKKL